MSIRKKILIFILPFFVMFGLVFLFLGLRSLQSQGDQSLKNIHSIMMEDKNEKLKDLVRNTFEILASQYRAASDPEQVAVAYKQQLQSIVNLAYTSVEGVYNREDLTDFQKKEEAKRIIKTMRYAGGNYLWINDLQAVMVMHPIKPALDGKDLSGFKDPTGKKLFMEMVSVAKKKGEGFVSYKWPKPGKEKPVAKLSYIRQFKPWGWVIGTGVYLETAEEQFKNEAKRQISNLRFGPEGKDYFFIVDMSGAIVMHPIKPSLNGKNMLDFKDPNGKKLFAEMIRVCREKGEGFVDYLWAKPGKDKPVAKLSFVKLFPKWNWIVGTGVYIDDIDDAMARQENVVRLAVSKQRTSILVVSLVLLVVVAFILVFIAGKISDPIRNMSRMLQDIAEGEGDLTSRLDVKTGDELEEMANWFNVFVTKLQDIIKKISNDSGRLDSSSEELATIAETMAARVNETSDKSNNVAAAVEEMSANMSAVAGSMNETASAVDMVASSVGEMTSTINEIAQTSEKARSITEKAVGQAASASSRVDELGEAAHDIDNVLATISEISDQVDLLALNATIEAARAGEAGKGFAVVASEIKELAQQTSVATQQVKERVLGIQNSTSATVGEINVISNVISENSEIVNTIATAVEEQSVTAGEISRNVDQILQGIQEINENISQSTTVSEEVAREIAEVNQASMELNKNATNVSESAGALKKLARGFHRLVGSFKV
ncbi:methyl-accepting chemotaxis protein [Desulfomarina profundi]|uniref:Methyl-accepting chemotaxis protein n=1 Tax=Desulfomarina profundi TaxID=2772557 RepID=A0A8D5JRS0_9BACT|nr:methyl-accepting chemotaxis protein [Desulfomarina profundi]BCL61341.1 methyl-accepting chemotaxis protein [Desulfomarina profundi]